MFERYTEQARRVLFFARFEASEFGATSIEPEHLLLGLTHLATGFIGLILERSHVSMEDIRKDIESRIVRREMVSTSIEMPFSDETKRVLQFAADEADRLRHPGIGPEHLFLALLREEGSVAASVLTARGLRVDDVRTVIVSLLDELSLPSGLSTTGAVERIEQIKRLVEQLAQTTPDSSEAFFLVERIRGDLDGLKLYLRE